MQGALSFRLISKQEYFFGHVFANLRELREGIDGYVDLYNTSCRYLDIGYLSPIDD
ncbi:IS3 family transposase [Ferrithrix thermotolerans]|uniref:IS3 family transposase n=1 Tax=Ferrithrix thermotolerans TaxID=209649 RepID=UPI000A02A77B